MALLNELHELVKGKVKSIVRAHDTSRVIECLVSLGDEKIRYYKNANKYYNDSYSQ